MGFLKGIFNFLIMITLSICLLITFSYGLLDNSVLSLEENEEMMETTLFTEQVTDEMLERYHMSLNELRFEKDVLLQFVTESGSGVLGYVFLENDKMPDVDVTFLKEYVIEEIEKESKSHLEGNVDIAKLMLVLREIPEGESITNGIRSYTESKSLNINQSEIDSIAKIYIENSDLEDEVLAGKMIAAVAVEHLNLDEMNTDLSLQNLFDRLVKRNPFTLLRSVYEVMDKNVHGYLPMTIMILIILLVVVEFRVGTTSVWISLALLLSILPLQLLRLADLFIKKDYIDIMGGLESYKEYMMDTILSKLNTYTIIVGILIVLIFILSKVLRKKVDTKIEHYVEDKNQSRFTLIRLGVFALLCVALYFNVNGLRQHNMALYDEFQSIGPADFDIESVDYILRDELNIDFDF